MKMKKSIIVVLALVTALAFTGMVAAQTATPAKPETKKEAVSKTAPAKTDAQKEETFKGKVVSVDVIANSIIVKNKKAEETFQVDPKAKILIDKKECKVVDIKKDHKVNVKYKVEGDKKVAVEITVK